jgi:hypothetical protein
VDFPRLWVAALRGDSLEPTDRYQVGVTVRWLWGDVKRFLYILKGPPAGYPGRYPTVWQGLREMLGRQPAGTRLEAWAADDRGPALGEWIQGIADLVAERRRHGAPPLVGATPADDAGRATHAGAVVRLER